MPEEIDARRFAFEEMERLAEKGFLKNTNWETYRGKYLADEFDSLNFVNPYAKEECPAINFLKAKKNLIDKKLQAFYQKVYQEDAPKDIKEIENSINFEKYYQSIQNYYDELKREIQKVMVNESEMIAEKSKGFADADQNFYYKLRYGSDQVYNTGYEFYLSIGNQYIDEHKPVSKETAKISSKEVYESNKVVRKERQKQRELIENKLTYDKNQASEVNYELERE